MAIVQNPVSTLSMAPANLMAFFLLFGTIIVGLMSTSNPRVNQKITITTLPRVQQQHHHEHNQQHGLITWPTENGHRTATQYGHGTQPTGYGQVRQQTHYGNGYQQSQQGYNSYSQSQPIQHGYNNYWQPQPQPYQQGYSTNGQPQLMQQGYYSTWPTARFYILSLQWTRSYCNTRVQRNCNYPLPWYFTIHGVWPIPEPWILSSTEPFDITVITNDQFLNQDMLLYWPSALRSPNQHPYESFWSHEWWSHGRHSGMDQATYFRTALQFARYYIVDADVQSLVFHPRQLNPNVLNYKLFLKFKKWPYLYCNEDPNGYPQLTEIRFNVSSSGQIQDHVQLPLSDHSCTRYPSVTFPQ